MIRLVLVLACYGFVVGAAQAGERWSIETCGRLAEMRDQLRSIEKEKRGDPRLSAAMQLPILARLHSNCAVGSMKEYETLEARANALMRAAKTAARARPIPDEVERAAPVEVDRASAPRQPMFCDTTPKAYGGSYTDCF